MADYHLLQVEKKNIYIYIYILSYEDSWISNDDATCEKDPQKILNACTRKDKCG